MNQDLATRLYNRLLEIKERINIFKSWDVIFNITYNFDKVKLAVELFSEEELTIISEWYFKAISEWPECYIDADGSKDLNFPVGGPLEYDEEIASGILWDNPKRHMLLDFLITLVKTE